MVHMYLDVYMSIYKNSIENIGASMGPPRRCAMKQCDAARGTPCQPAAPTCVSMTRGLRREPGQERETMP